jgi:hypothetical protein
LTADVVFFVDTSPSMYDGDLDGLSAAWGSLVDALLAVGADYQLAAVTDQDGCVDGGTVFVDESEARDDQIAALQAMVDLDDGANAEQGFTALAAATDPLNTAAGGCNEGLLRAGARLVLVGVSDESEQSPNDWSYYVSLLEGRVADPDDLSVNAIAGDVPSGCGRDASAGLGWYEAGVVTGGLFESICADWDDNLAALGDLGAEDFTRYELDGWPVDESAITVTVDGVVVTDWVYDAADNQVELDEAPPEGSTVTITWYEDACP